MALNPPPRPMIPVRAHERGLAVPKPRRLNAEQRFAMGSIARAADQASRMGGGGRPARDVPAPMGPAAVNPVRPTVGPVLGGPARPMPPGPAPQRPLIGAPPGPMTPGRPVPVRPGPGNVPSDPSMGVAPQGIPAPLGNPRRRMAAPPQQKSRGKSIGSSTLADYAPRDRG